MAWHMKMSTNDNSSSSQRVASMATNSHSFTPRFPYFLETVRGMHPYCWSISIQIWTGRQICIPSHQSKPVTASYLLVLCILSAGTVTSRRHSVRTSTQEGKFSPWSEAEPGPGHQDTCSWEPWKPQILVGSGQHQKGEAMSPLGSMISCRAHTLCNWNDKGAEPGIVNEKKKEEISKAGPGHTLPPRPPHPCQKNLKVKTNLTCTIWGILEANLKKSSTLKFMMYITFVPSICIHRSIILIFMEKYACQFFSLRKILFSAIFDFHFHENPCFRDEFQALRRYYEQSNVFIYGYAWLCLSHIYSNRCRLIIEVEQVSKPQRLTDRAFIRQLEEKDTESWHGIGRGFDLVRKKT